MSDAATIAQAYLDTWNETDATRRARLLREHWSNDAQYVDPMMSGSGAEQIGALVDAVQQRFPGFRFVQLGTADGHGARVRLAWSLGPDGAEPPIKGSDVLELRDGRIRRVIGFLDQVPASA